MALDPSLFAKKQGDTVNSKDWNAGFSEVDQLDKSVAGLTDSVAKLDAGKVNLAGGASISGTVQMNGDLYTNGGLIANANIQATKALLAEGGLTVYQGLDLYDGAIAPSHLGYKSAALGVSLPLNATAVYLDMERYQAGSPPPYPAFFRVSDISVANALVTIGNTYAVKQNDSGVDTIVRGVMVTGPGAYVNTVVTVVVYWIPVPYGLASPSYHT